MAKDYTIRFTGQDDLSNTINKVKNELKDVGSSTVNIDKIEQKFKKIESSTAPLKRKLKDLQGIMAQMNLDGLSNTDQFTRMAEQAGKYKDAISDAKQATSNFANDTFKLEAGIQAFEGVAGAASIAAGAMGLLGGENKKVQQAILQVQGALSLVNGAQAVANVLNKDSALMLRLKSIWAAASATATTADAVAEGVDTVAVGANTIALKAWNIAKAVGKALLGDWTGLVLVGAVALGTYALATNNSTDAEQEHTKALKSSGDAVDTYRQKFVETATSLITNYSQLRAEWQQLSTAQEKAKWIKDNQTKFDELGISVLNTKDAENAFVNNTNSVIKSLQLRAKAAAAAALAQQSYEKALGSVRRVSISKGQFLGNRDEITLAKQAGTLYTKNGASYSNGNVSGMVGNINAYNESMKEGNQLIQQNIYLTKQANSITGYRGKTSSSGSSGRTNKNGSGNKNTNNNTNTEIAPVGSLKYLDNEISALQKKMSLATDTGVIAGYKTAIAKLQDQKDTLNFEANLINFNKTSADIPESAKKMEVNDNPLDLSTPLNSNLNIDTKSLDDTQERTKGIQQAAMDAAQSFSQLGQAIGGVAGAGIDIAGMMAQAIVTMIQGYATATSQAAKLGPWAWISFGALGLAQLTAMISTVKSAGAFADGGVINGNSYHGDGLLANVNAGEMILNTKQQSNLFKMLDGANGNTSTNGVTFKIQGKELVGVLNNYNSKMNKVR